MRPVRTEDATILYRAPKNMPDCGDLYCHRVRPGVIRSTWEPTPGELALLNEGGRVQLTLAHEPIPPIMLEVMDKDITEPVAEHPWREQEPQIQGRDNGNDPTEDTTEQTTPDSPEGA